MFAMSTQRAHWIFPDENELSRLKTEAHEEFINKHASDMPESGFLSVDDEELLVKYYESGLKAFCKAFRPAMPPTVMAVAMIYLKRIYLKHSVMDYNPRDTITTCIYLACKVEEFNVSLQNFVSQLKKDRGKVADQILWFELPLMQLLNFQLTVHTAYRPLEGLIINLKTHSPDIDVERLRPNAAQFLELILSTNAYLLYAPSQIALAALMDSAARADLRVNYFLTEHLMRGADRSTVEKVLKITDEIIAKVAQISRPSRDQIREIESRLERCRNQELNPNSELFQSKMRELEDDDDFQQLDLYKADSQEQERMEQSIIQVSMS